VAELAGLEAALPDQPLRVGVVLTGAKELDGWWGKGRAASWADAIEAARAIGRICRVRLDIRADKHAPWHPGRCAAIYVQVAGSDGQREWLAGAWRPLVESILSSDSFADRGWIDPALAR
jgi:phenylalanyl-tRNA synthetase beta chain